VTDGQVTPFGLEYLELGFEVYYASYYAPYVLTPDVYASIVINYTVAAKQIDPRIQISISVDPLDTGDGGWDMTLFGYLYGNATEFESFTIDGLSTHLWNYYDLIPYLYLGVPVEGILTQDDLIPQALSNLNSLVSSYPANSLIPRKLWITGYNHEPNYYSVLNNVLDCLNLVDMALSIMNFNSNNMISGSNNLTIMFGNIFNLGDSVYGLFDSYDYPGYVTLRPSYYPIQMIMSAFENSTFYSLTYSFMNGNFPQLYESSVAVEFFAYTNNNVINILILNKACQQVTLNVTFVGNSILDKSRNATFLVVNGNYQATEVVPVDGSDLDPGTVQSSYDGWVDNYWANYGTVSYLDYSMPVTDYEYGVPITVLGTSFTVCTVPIKP